MSTGNERYIVRKINLQTSLITIDNYVLNLKETFNSKEEAENAIRQFDANGNYIIIEESDRLRRLVGFMAPAPSPS